MKNNKQSTTSPTAHNESERPKIRIKKLGIVSHDYSGGRDFSDAFDLILKCLDERGCDSVLFSLTTIDKRNNFDAKINLGSLTKITSVFVEEYGTHGDEYVIYYKTSKQWEEHKLTQKFGKLEYTKDFEENKIKPFIEEVRNQRVFGNCTVLLCGETNIVKYSKDIKDVYDKFNFLNAIPSDVTVLLNPIHDRMTRFEMKLKRRFLSKKGKWVVSVWNKGKKDKNGKVKDGEKPAWTVFHNETEVTIEKVDIHSILARSSIEIGILDIKNA